MHLWVLGLLPIFTTSPLTASKSWYLTSFAGVGLAPFMGSEDPRTFGSIGIAFARPERRLRSRQYRAELVLEGYYERSTSPGIYENLPNGTDAVGVLAMARYRHKSMFVDIGWGFQYTDQRTVDVSGRLSSTPNATIGVVTRAFDRELLIGLRYVHISNAGLSGNNQGSNRLGLFGAMRY